MIRCTCLALMASSPRRSNISAAFANDGPIGPGVFDLDQQRHAVAFGPQGQTLIQEGKKASGNAGNGPPRGGIRSCRVGSSTPAPPAPRTDPTRSCTGPWQIGQRVSTPTWPPESWATCSAISQRASSSVTSQARCSRSANVTRSVLPVGPEHPIEGRFGQRQELRRLRSRTSGVIFNPPCMPGDGNPGLDRDEPSSPLYSLSAKSPSQLRSCTPQPAAGTFLLDNRGACRYYPAFREAGGNLVQGRQRL